MRWHEYVPFRHLDNKLSKVLENGFLPEFYLDSYQLSDKNLWRKAKNIIGKDSTDASLHVTLIDLNPGSIDPSISEVTKKRFLQNFEFARYMDIKDLVVHTAFDPFRYHFFTSEFKESSLSFWKSLEDEIDGFNIALENVFDRDFHFLDEIIKLLNQEINNSNFGWCFDIGHANLFKKITHKEWIDALSDNLLEIHIHDNNGEYDEHLSLGKGNINFINIFKFLKSNILKNNIILNFELEEIDWAIEARNYVKEFLDV